MELNAYSAAVMAGAAAMWLMSGTQRERPLVGTAGDSVTTLEARASARGGDPEGVRALAQAYLDAHQPGLALVLVEACPAAVRADVRVRHVRARALLDEGRNEEALAAEREVLGACGAIVDGRRAPAGCDAVLFASAVRRAGILAELLALGVEDAQAHPEASLVAYQNATREARVAME